MPSSGFVTLLRMLTTIQSPQLASIIGPGNWLLKRITSRSTPSVAITARPSVRLSTYALVVSSLYDFLSYMSESHLESHELARYSARDCEFVLVTGVFSVESEFSTVRFVHGGPKYVGCALRIRILIAKEFLFHTRNPRKSGKGSKSRVPRSVKSVLHQSSLGIASRKGRRYCHLQCVCTLKTSSCCLPGHRQPCCYSRPFQQAHFPVK